MTLTSPARQALDAFHVEASECLLHHQLRGECGACGSRHESGVGERCIYGSTMVVGKALALSWEKNVSLNFRNGYIVLNDLARRYLARFDNALDRDIKDAWLLLADLAQELAADHRPPHPMTATGISVRP